MAPYAADTAVAARKPVRRPARRIVPAIPFAFSRAPPSAKPSTPEEPATEPVTQSTAEPQPTSAPEEEKPEKGEDDKVEELPSEVIHAPHTPASKASDTNTALAEEPAPASSQVDSHDDALEKSLTRDSADSQLNVAEDASSTLPAGPRAASAEQSAATSPSPAAPCIPAELPPPFYPAEKLYIHVAPLENVEASFPTHHTHPSVEGLVFDGDAYKSPAAPSTPHDLEPETIAPQQTFARVPPGFAPPFAPAFYPGHTHHLSDAVPAPWMFSQYHMAPLESLHSHRQEYSPPLFQAGHIGYQGSYQGQFSHPAPHVLNGAAQSHSQSTNKAHFGTKKSSSDYEEELHTSAYQNGTNMQSIDAKLEESPFELAAYLSSQFGNPEFADFVLQMRSEDTVLLSLPIHGIVVARSPVIAQAIHSSTMSTYRTKDSRRLVDILFPDKFITSESLNETVKVLYGAPLLTVESFLYGLRPFHHDGEQGPTYNEARKRMGQAISYAAAGRALKIPCVQARGTEIIKSLIRWDTFDQAIHFGLDGRSSRGPPASRQNGSAPDQPYSGNLDTYGIAPLHDAIEFLAYNFPAPFTLYSLAQELRLDPRLPSIVEFRSATHNPRLSRIQFGDAPPEREELKPDYISRNLSSVLVSIPLIFLQRLFSHRATANQLGWTGVVKVMRDVVDEREKRRQKALKSQLRPSEDGTVPQFLLENLYWEERVESSSMYTSGFKISEARLADHVKEST